MAYALQLPSKIKIHNVFLINLLKPYIPLVETLFVAQPGPINYLEGDNIFEVKSILDYHKHHYEKGIYEEYLVVWDGYPITKAT